ncbi:MAG: translocation/assembly module TamB domain-containing protein [Sulfurifustaceae bacterium]
MTRRLLWLFLLALLLLSAAAVSWLFATEAGLRWTYARLQSALPGTLEIEMLDGRLMGPLIARGVRYRTPTLDARVRELVLDWSPAQLLRGRVVVQNLSLRDTRVQLFPSTENEPPPSPSFRFPLKIEVARFSADNLQIAGADQTPFDIQTIRFGGTLDTDRLEVDQLELSGRQLELNARGALARSAGSERLTVDVRFDGLGPTPLAAHAELAGNLADLAIDVRTSEPLQSELHGKVKDALTQPAWQVQWRVPAFNLNRLKPNLVGAAALDVSASGDRARFESRGTLTARYADLPVTGSFRLSGSTNGALRLDELVLRSPPARAQISASGDWNSASGVAHADVRWRDLDWPTQQPLLTSPTGRLQVNGTPSRYHFTLTAESRGAKFPTGTLHASGRGDVSAVSVDTLTLETLNGVVEGQGRAAWSPRLTWDVSIKGRGLDPGVAWPQWRGDIALSAQASGRNGEIRVALPELKGTLRDRAFSARGEAWQRGTTYPRLALNVRSGNATINIAGGLQNEWNLGWQIDAPNLAALWPETGGRLRANGRITGRRAQPTIQARMTGSELRYNDLQARTLDAEANIDLSDRQSSRLDVRLANAVIGARALDRMALNGTGYVSKHSLALNAHMGDMKLALGLNGGVRDASWRGALASGTWDIGAEHWTLNRPAALFASATRIELAPTCWRGGAAELCARVNHTTGDTTVALNATDVPLALLARLLDNPIDLRGRFGGTGELQLHGGRLRHADARVQTSAGSVRAAAAGVGTALEYEQARATLQVDDHGLRAHAELRLAGSDGATFDVALPQFNAPEPTGANQPVKGSLVLALRDLSPFAALLPEVEQLRGTLRADLSIQGTLADPQLRGSARMSDAAGRIAALGILVHDVRIDATPEGRDIRLSGYARSGNGELALTGRFMLGAFPAWRAELRIAGSQFEAVDLRETHVNATPDLRVQLAPGVVNVQGEVLIPRASFAPRPQRRNIAPSSDVVIEGGPDTAAETPTAWAVTASIKVTLGDKVSFEGFGLNAMIAGSITLIDTPAQVTTARGELNVTSGRYEAYGQKLTIERGRLLFAGGPVDDPAIDARAIRRVDPLPGASAVTAGIEVKGTLKAPQLTLFSDPTMAQSDALSYLLFGQPVDTANPGQGAALASASRALQLSGGERLAQRLGSRLGLEDVEISQGPNSEAALVLGKRLSPRLYINYSIGLVEPINTVRIRYQVTTHWILQAESGLHGGADLIYTIER